MKTFIGAVITLGVLILCVTLNCIYIENAAAELLSTAADLPSDVSDSDVSALKDQWDSFKSQISFTVGHKETDEIDDTIYGIEVHISEKNQSAYASAVAMLKCQLLRLAESEALSIERIF